MTPVSIKKALAVLPSGDPTPDLSLVELSRYLQTTIATDVESRRNARHARRDDLYRDGGCQYMEGVINHVFQDDTVRQLRKKWVEHARFNNPLKRVVNELSTVYAEPAKRSVEKASQETYEQVLELVEFNEQMLQISRLLNLHRAMLVGFRVRMLPDGSREPVIDMASPADVRVVLHPNDNRLPIGWIVRSSYRPARLLEDRNIPKWTLWTDVERVGLRDDFSVIQETYVEHRLGVNPWVPVTLGPVTANFWPGEEGEDLVAAHVAIWITNILLLKESKSATKQPVITGDGTNVARAQAADSEVPIETADGQSISTVDMSMDLSMFRNTADHILEHVAQNYGMSAALINHQGVQSAEAREMMRIPLRELRKHQQIPLRRFERRFAEVMSKVLAVDLPSMSFDTTGWHIEFGESQTPLSETDALNLFLAARTAGLDNSADFLMRTRDMSEEQAVEWIERCVKIELLRNVMMRPLQQISGSMGAPQPAQFATNPSSLDVKIVEESHPGPVSTPPHANVSPAPAQ